MNFISRSRNAFLSAVLLMGGAATLIAGTAQGDSGATLVGQGTTSQVVPAGGFQLHADLNTENDATDVGDVWVTRAPTAAPTVDAIGVDVVPTGGSVTKVTMCIAGTPWAGEVGKNDCLNPVVGKLPGAGNEIDTSVPKAKNGEPLYLNIRVVVNGKNAYAMYHQAVIYITAQGYGNMKVPALGYNGPKDICPANPEGWVLNRKIMSNGNVVTDLNDIQGTTAKVNFTVAPNCSDKEVSYSWYKTMKPEISQTYLDTQKLVDSVNGKYSQASGPNYTVNSVSLNLEPECYYQIDLYDGPVQSPPFKIAALYTAGHGGDRDCRNDVPTTTTTTEPPTTTTTAEVLPTSVVKPSTTTTTVKVLGEQTTNLPKTGTETMGLAMVGAGLVTGGASLRGLMRTRRRRG